MNVQRDYVHVVVMIPSKVAVSESLGRLKGQTSIKLFNNFRELEKNPIGAINFGQRATVWIR